MKNYKLHISDGFKDLYGDEMLISKEIENRVLNTFSSFGYELIKTPGLEYIDVYSLDSTQKPDLYNLINRQGEVLSLRNDMTSSVARFVSTNNSLKGDTYKYCYCADTYRYPRLYQGKNHQFLQAGIELIGNSSIESDVEAIYLASQALKACNCNKFTINIGSSLFLDTLFDDFKINNDVKKLILQSVENKDYVSLKNILNENLDAEHSKLIFDLMIRGGKLKFIENLMNSLKGKKSQEVLKYLKNIYLTLRELDVDNIIFDFSIYSYQKYYTGIIFNIFVDNITKALVFGGRCDSLFKKYGKDLPNVGFGLDLDLLTSYILNSSLIDVKKKKYLAYQDGENFISALKFTENLKSENIILSWIKFNNLDEALEYAKENSYDKVVEFTKSGISLKEVK